MTDPYPLLLKRQRSRLLKAHEALQNTPAPSLTPADPPALLAHLRFLVDTFVEYDEQPVPPTRARDYDAGFAEIAGAGARALTPIADGLKGVQEMLAGELRPGYEYEEAEIIRRTIVGIVNTALRAARGDNDTAAQGAQDGDT